MKICRLLFILLFSTALHVSGQEAKKPYHNTRLTVTSTLVNSKGVRLIYGKNSQYDFIFICNADDNSCKAPQLGYEYELFDDSPLNAYKCDEYRMFRRTGDWCIVCLDTVQQVTS